jgi:site-specific DNA-methyltransferase (adenine-specific)
MQKALSMLTREEMRTWLRSSWTDLPGESTRRGHPAPFPVAVATRLIRLFSFAGDTVLDPFAGTGSTLVAAIECGRNSLGVDIEPAYLQIARGRLFAAAEAARQGGAAEADVRCSPCD